MPSGIYKRTEETRRRLSESKKGDKNPAKRLEVRKKMSLARIGRKHSKETKEKMSMAHKKNPVRYWLGKKLTEEHRKNMSIAAKGKPKLKLRGIKRSKEFKRKISEIMQGRKLSEDHKKHISKTRKKIFKERGYLNSLETRKKMSGENNSNWQGGISFEPYSKSFNNIFKRRIRKRDNYICMLCNIHQERLNRALSVHHINYDKKLTIPQNCCALCNSCNSEVNFNRTSWTKFFQNLLSEKYGYEYSEIGEIQLIKK